MAKILKDTFSIAANWITEKERVRSRFLIGIWLLAIAVEVLLLTYDVYLFPRNTNASEDRPIVAKLIEQVRTVRVQRFGDLIWLETEKDQGLRDGYSLLTSDASRAQVEFEDGSRFAMAENSLVQISSPEKRQGKRVIRLELVRGSFSKKKGKESTVDFELKHRDAELKFGADSELSLVATGKKQVTTVHNGTVQLEIGGDKQEVGEGEHIVLSDRAAPKVVKSRFYLISPTGGKVVGLSETQSVVFKFELLNEMLKNQKFRVEVARDALFTQRISEQPARVTDEERIYSARARLALPSEPRSYFWRVNPVGGRPTPVGEFRVQPLVPITLYHPLSFGEMEERLTAHFSWEEISDAREYEFVLKKGKETVHENTHAAPFVSLFIEEPGTYRWRVRAKLQSGLRTPWTRFRPLRVKVEAPPPPPPSELEGPEVVPQKKRKSSFLDWLIPTVHAQGRTWNLKLKWGEVEGADRYRIQIGRTQSFSRILADEVVSDPEYVWRYRLGMENSKGRVFYRVASVNKRGRSGAFSAPREVPIPDKIMVLIRKRQKKKTRKVPSVWNFAASIGMGFGDLTQTSTSSGLNRVEMNELYFNQSFDLAMSRHAGKRRWFALLHLDLAGFQKPKLGRAIEQPDVVAYNLSLSAIYFKKHWGLGGEVGRFFRWVKMGPQTVQQKGTLSFGPVISYVRNFKLVNDIKPVETGGSLRLPFTGIFTKSHFGAQGSAWLEWNLATLGYFPSPSLDKVGGKLNSRRWLGLRLQADVSYLRWQEPSGTSLFTWSFWLAPTFHLREI